MPRVRLRPARLAPALLAPALLAVAPGGAGPGAAAAPVAAPVADPVADPAADPVAAPMVAVAVRAPAAAGPCPPGTGVTVVVDFGRLGGGTRVGCAEADGGSGADAVTGAGFDLTGVVTEPGFVCRIDGRPTPEAEDCRQTPPGDAYWGLFVADRAGAAWAYAAVGIDSLEPAAGSYLGLRFQDGSGRVPPLRDPVAPRGTPAAGGGPAGTTDAATTGRGTPGATLVPVAATLAAGLLAATYLAARRRRPG